MKLLFPSVGVVLLGVVATGQSVLSSSSSLRGKKLIQDTSSRSGIISVPLIPHRARYPPNDPSSNNNDHVPTERRYGRRRRLEDPESPVDAAVPQPEVDALYQGYGTHYVDLWIGTPAQRQTVIVDTGSSVTAFPCSDCSNCGSGYHVDNYFQNLDSSTFVKVPCGECLLGQCSDYTNPASSTCPISVAYQEGSSWNAFEAADIVYSGGPHDIALADQNDFVLHFGCQTHLTGLFQTQLEDGIMGMEMSDLSFWKQMYDAGALMKKSFSLCYTRQPKVAREGTNAGAMSLGGVDTRLHETTMVYVNQLNTQGWYTVRIKHIYLRSHGGERVEVPVELQDAGNVKLLLVDVSEDDMNRGDVILDSGTTDTYLSAKIQAPFSSAWKNLTGRDYDNDSHHYTEDELAAMPTVLFQLEGDNAEGVADTPMAGLAGALDPSRPNDVLVAMPAWHFLEYRSETKQFTSRLYFNEVHGGVLGANFIMGHDVFFDIDNERVGFAESDCDYAQVADGSK